MGSKKTRVVWPLDAAEMDALASEVNAEGREPAYQEILKLWLAGEGDKALTLMESHHPAVAAVVLVHGTMNSSLTRYDCCKIASLLAKRRRVAEGPGCLGKEERAWESETGA